MEDDEFADPDALHELLYPAYVVPPHGPRPLFPGSGVSGGYMPSAVELKRTRPRPRQASRRAAASDGRLVSALLLAQHKATRDPYVTCTSFSCVTEGL